MLSARGANLRFSEILELRPWRGTGEVEVRERKGRYCSRAMKLLSGGDLRQTLHDQVDDRVDVSDAEKLQILLDGQAVGRGKAGHPAGAELGDDRLVVDSRQGGILGGLSLIDLQHLAIRRRRGKLAFAREDG